MIIDTNNVGSKSAEKEDTRPVFDRFKEDPAKCTEKDLYEVKSFYNEQASHAVANILYKRKKAFSESSSSSIPAA